MKTYFILHIIILLLFGGCSKDNSDLPNSSVLSSLVKHPSHYTKHGFGNDTFTYNNGLDKNFHEAERMRRYNELCEKLASEENTRV